MFGFDELPDRRPRIWRMTAVFAVTGALALGGCSNSSESDRGRASATTAAPVGKVDTIANTVPEAIKSSGQLIVGVNIPYPPNEFKDPEGKIVGFDVDLMTAISETLGLTPEYREVDFAKIIPSIQGGTLDVGMSSFTDSKEREEQVDFVTYFSAGTLWAQPAGGEIDPENACGKRVAVQSTTVQETEELPARSQRCTDSGQSAIEIIPFDNQDAVTNAVVLGQADAMSADSPVTLYAIKQTNGKLEPAGEVFDSALYGWPVQKGSPLAQSLLQALQHVIETGKYQEIASNWGLEEGMIDKPTINGAVS